ncbi:MAG: aminoglycoside phosphotransferase family protein, partial [Alphaproteobacteria bacterium]|nr:aminoglycoside phosphotransferase family protein [Alphaproteobacteria bacterium]
AIRELRFGIRKTPPVFLHMDYWPGNVLWLNGRVSAVLDWDAAGYGDAALDVGYFRMNMYLRGVKEAAGIFLEHYEAARGPVLNLGFWELACAARPLPVPSAWIPFSRQMGDLGATDDRAETDYYEFVEEAMGRAREGR